MGASHQRGEGGDAQRRTWCGKRQTLCRCQGSTGRGTGQWSDPGGGRLWVVWNPGGIDCSRARQWGRRVDRDLQQRWRRRIRAWSIIGHPADPQDDFVLRGRKQGIRTPIPGGRTRAGVQSARHPGRAFARRWRGHSCVLHRHRLRHDRGRGQGNARIRRQALRAGNRVAGRRGAGQGMARRYRWQPGIPQDRAQFQSRLRHGRTRVHRRGRGHRGAGRHRSDQVHLPGIYVDRLVLNATPEKRIEQRTVREGQQ